MKEIKIEETQYEFLSPELTRPTKFIRRFSNGGMRYYYTVSDTGDVKIYSSGTTLIKDGYAQDTSALEAWRNKLKSEGKDPRYELIYSATRGTLLHILIGDYIQGLQIGINDIGLYLSEKHPDSLNNLYFDDVISKDSEWLVKGVLAFGQFVKDYNVKPLALELIMASDKYMVASPLDIIAKMDVEEKGFFGEVYKTGEKKGQPKESKRVRTVNVIIDIKSSQNGFYDSHYFQLQLYKRILKENYPDLEIEALFNWSPKDWRTTPTYNLKEQSDGRLNDLCETVFEQGRIKHAYKTPTITKYKDLVSIEDYNAESLIETISLKEYLENFHKT